MKAIVTAQRLYTDATRVNVSDVPGKRVMIPAARLTKERGATARHRINDSIRAGKARRARKAGVPA